MDSEQVREFLVFTHTMNYSTAAKELFISNTTLASHISALETEIGTALVEKRSSQFILTPAGASFVNHCRTILHDIDSAITDCLHISRTTVPIRIASNNLSNFEIKLWEGNRILSTLHPDSTKYDLTAVQVFSQGIEALDKTDADIAPLAVPRISSEQPLARLAPKEGYAARYFFTEVLVLHISSAHPLYSKEHIRASDLDGMKLLYVNDEAWIEGGELLASMLQEKGINISVKVVHANSFIEYSLLSNDSDIKVIGSGALDRYASEQDMGGRIIQLADLPLYWDTYMVFPKDSERSSAIASFVEEVSSIITPVRDAE